METKVLVLVLSLDREPWKAIETEGQRTTWAAGPHGDSPILYLYGRSSGVGYLLAGFVRRALRLVHARGARTAFIRWTGRRTVTLPVREEGDRVLTGVPEGYANVSAKTIAGFRHLLAHHDFDFVFRTNTSTYVNCTRLLDFARALPAGSFYGGFVGEKDGLRYASGAGVLLSRDLVEVAAADPVWDFGKIDDIALAGSMLRHGIEVQPLPRTDVLTTSDLAALTKDALAESLFVRCKSTEGDRTHDVAVMRRVHELTQ